MLTVEIHRASSISFFRGEIGTDNPLQLFLVVRLAVAGGHAAAARDYHCLELLKAALRHRGSGGWECEAVHGLVRLR